MLLVNYGNRHLSNRLLLIRLFPEKISFVKKFDSPNVFCVAYTIFSDGHFQFVACQMHYTRKPEPLSKTVGKTAKGESR